ncbi:MAG: BON domain-containing protein [Elusimicrobiota bacterium]|nr:MAG: BON domain-containing protein [Elusimicrobiota bacterium]
MKTGPTLAVAVVGALAVAGVLHSQTTNAPSQNPSSTTSPQNPSSTTSPQNPSQTVPGQNPSDAGPTLPNPTAPGPDVPLVTDPNAAPAANGGTVLVDRVRTAVMQGPPTSSGVPSSTTPGVSVNDFTVVAGENGKVTLRGFVHSAKERSEAEERAAAIAGRGNVVNELKVR